MTYHSGRHYLQIPGPTNVPERVQRAMHRAVMDHRGPEFAELSLDVLEGIKTIFKTKQPVIIFPSSGSGAWEAALMNTLSPGDTVLMYESGMFATLWCNMAKRLGLNVDFIESDWRRGADPEAIEAKLKADTDHKIRAVCVVHNETSTGISARMPMISEALKTTKHPALLMVDTISSLGSMDYRHDDWGVDVSVGGSQKGLMLPPGMSFTAVSERALEASKTAKMPRWYWAWDQMLANNKDGFFPYTPATTLLYGLQESITMLHEEGLDNVFARHARHGAATRAAVNAWGLENVCLVPEEYSAAVTSIMLPEGHDADAFRKVVLDNFNMSLGTGLGKLAGRVFRIGHLGDLGDISLAGTLAGVEMGLTMIGLHNAKGGATAGFEHLAACASK